MNEASLNEENGAPILTVNRSMLSYWKELGQSHLPEYGNFRPSKMPKDLWRSLFITKIVAEPFQVEFIYQGLEITDELSQNFIGKFIGPEIFGDNYEDVLNLYRRVWDHKCPVISTETVTDNSGVSIINEVLHLPFVDDQNRVTHIAGSIDRMRYVDDAALKKQQFGHQGAAPEDWRVEEIIELDDIDWQAA